MLISHPPALCQLCIHIASFGEQSRAAGDRWPASLPPPWRNGLGGRRKADRGCQSWPSPAQLSSAQLRRNALAERSEYGGDPEAVHGPREEDI